MRAQAQHHHRPADLPPDAADRLEARARELQQALDALTEDDEPADPQGVNDFKDQALRQMDAELDRAQADRLQAELDQVQAARQRLAAGAYGRCSVCGRAIEPARLAALPEALHCLACQAEREARG